MMRLFDRLQVLFDHLLDNSEFNIIRALRFFDFIYEYDFIEI